MPPLHLTGTLFRCAVWKRLMEIPYGETTTYGEIAKELSAGGGTVLREENRKLLKEIGEVIYLRITPEEVIARLGNDRSRPMLNAPDRERQIREMMEYREPMYRDAADREIDAGHRKPEEIAEEILKTV